MSKLRNTKASPNKKAITVQPEVGSPMRVTRSRVTSQTDLGAEGVETSSGGGSMSKKKPKRPLTLKDPFSPKLTEEQRNNLLRWREKEKAKPRKRYSAITKVKSKRI